LELGSASQGSLLGSFIGFSRIREYGAAGTIARPSRGEKMSIATRKKPGLNPG
jgi:hypothetical protein